jgi:nitrate reductase assembly molybdenum cofactor insertion protein NarJ
VANEYGKEIMDFINAYQKTIDVPLRYTESPSHLPQEIKDLSKYGEVQGFAKGGIVDKPLYDRAV